jgi:hypothetical protein
VVKRFPRAAILPPCHVIERGVRNWPKFSELNAHLQRRAPRRNLAYPS